MRFVCDEYGDPNDHTVFPPESCVRSHLDASPVLQQRLYSMHYAGTPRLQRFVQSLLHSVLTHANSDSESNSRFIPVGDTG